MRLPAFALLLLAAPLPATEPPGHRFLAADRTHAKLAVVGPDGQVEWEFANRHEVHDLHRLPNGNVLTHTSPTNVVEIAPTKEIVWKYEAKPAPGGVGRVEVHAFQRLPDGNTMVAESGNSRIVEVNKAGEVVKAIKLKVGKPNAHSDTRLARKLANGNYLVAQEADGVAREYDAAGTVVWEYALDLGGRPASGGHGPEGHGTSLYSAVRLPNGHTLIGGGNNNRVLEVTPDKKIVWSVDQKELPGITLAWVTTVQQLPNGNVVIGNCHAGRGQPQLIEVTRDKKVVWSYENFALFGNNLAASQVLEEGVVR